MLVVNSQVSANKKQTLTCEGNKTFTDSKQVYQSHTTFVLKYI